NDCPEITTSRAAARHTRSHATPDNERGDEMQRFGIYLFSLALTFGGYAARAAGDTKAAELLAQARAALGGDAKLAKVQGLSAAGTYQRELGDRQLSGEITIDFELPDKMVRTNSMNPIGD